MFCLTVDPEIKLGLFEERHATELFALIEANRAHLRQWMPWLDTNTSVADTLKFIKESLEQFARGEGFTVAILFQEKWAGVIGYHELDQANRSIEIGYWLSADLQGRGIVTRACGFMVDYAFNELGLNRVAICCAVDNRRSRAIPERLGFKHEGTLRQAEFLYDDLVDHAVYGLLAEEWARTQKEN